MNEPILIEEIGIPFISQKLQCEISDQEIRSAKSQILSIERMLLDDYCSFKPAKEYRQGDVDAIVNRMRGNGRICYGPPMVCANNPLNGEGFRDILNTGTFNGIIRILVRNPSLSNIDLISQAQDEFSNGLPFPHFEKLIIPVFGTTGLKHKLKNGEFEYDSSGGHFICLYLSMESSSVTIYDSLNVDITDSPYFDFKKISKVCQALHDFYKEKRNQEIQPLKFIQQRFQQQYSVDCGCNTLINVELLLRQFNPAIQRFDRSVIQKIRYYHFLLREFHLHEFKLNFDQ